MRNIILAILILCSLGAFAQRESKVSDSTRFTKGVRFDSTLVFKRLKAAAVKDTVLVIMDANGTVSKINKSNLLSVISGGGSQTLSISGDTLSISDGNSVVLPVYVQADSSTISSYDVLNSQNAPPGSPAIGDTYLVGNSPSGAWAGHSKDIAEWNGSAWVFTDGVQGDFLYNATNALTYIFRSGNWVQTTGIPALHNGNTISSGLKIGTNNARSLKLETANLERGRIDSLGHYYIYDTSLRYSNKYVQVDSLTGRLIATEIPYNDGFIPLSGTVSGSPVTGDIVTSNEVSLKVANGSNNGFNALFFGESFISISTNDNNVNLAETKFTNNGIEIASNNPIATGITGLMDFTANITDLDYTQKKYVDTHISDTATQIRSEIPDVSSYATITNLKDSTALVRGLITSSIPTFSLSKNSTRDSIVTTYNGIRSAVKDSSIVMPTFSFGRNASLDSIYAIYNGTRYSAKDSLPTTSATSTTTFTNKRITARVDSTTSSATPTINTDNVDTYKLTAQAADITSFTTNLSGTPTDDQILHIVIIGTATRAITWGAKFEASTVALPTTTVGTTRLDVYFIWNTATSKWRCGGVW